MDIATGVLKYLNNDSWDVENAALSEDRELLAYVINENGLSTLHVVDLKSGKPRSVPKLPTGEIGTLRWNENNRDIAFSLASAQSPSDVTRWMCRQPSWSGGPIARPVAFRRRISSIPHS